jgi:dienelactone hydrolase
LFADAGRYILTGYFGREFLRFLSLLLAGSLPVGLSAQEPSAIAFGAREGIEHVSMSPDGTKLAYIVPATGQGSKLYTVDIANGGVPRVALAASGDPQRLSSCEWVSNARLICLIVMVLRDTSGPITASRLVAINADSTELKMVSMRQGANAERISYFGGNLIDLLPSDDGAVLVGREYVPEGKTGSIITKNKNGYGVDRVDTLTLNSKQVVTPTRLAVEYISDGLGTVRIMGVMKTESGYDSGVRRYLYRTMDQNDWKQLGEYDFTQDTGFNPYSVDPVENVVYGFEKTDGRFALYKVKLDGTLTKTKIFSRPDVDVDGLITLGRTRQIVGVTYATDRRQSSYFDPALKQLGASLSKALPGADLINFAGMSADGQKMVIWAGSDMNPGQYYFFDKSNNNISPLFASRPELAGYKLAPVKAVNVKAADGTIIPGYLTLPLGSTGKGLPAIVMPHGGPSARDEWGFDWLAQYFAHQGFAVLQPNFRGSAGYGDDWYQQNGFQSWKTAIGDVNDSGRWLVSEGIAAADKLAIFGWSYGGYAALQSAVLDPALFKAIVAVAPVTDLAMLKQQDREYMSYRVNRDFIGSGPHITEGSPARNAEKISAPVMIFHGELDRNVNINQAQFMVNRLKDAGSSPELFTYKDLDHYLENSAVRAEMLEKSSDFIKSKLGIK